MDKKMKKILLGLGLALVSFTSWSACDYNFDATQADIQSQGSERFTSVNGSEVSYNTTLANKVYVAMSKSIFNTILSNPDSTTAYNSLTGDKILNTSGIQAFEFKIKVPEIKNNTTMLNIFPIMAGGKMANGENMNIMISYQKLGSTNSFYVNTAFAKNIGQVIQLPVQNTADGYQRIGIYLNQNSNQLGVIFNGVNKGYIDTYPSKLKNIFYSIGSNYTNMTATDVGKEIRIKLLLDSVDLLKMYPTGTTDICGNMI